MTTILRECFFEYAGRYSGEYNLILAYVSDTNDSFVSGGSYTPSADTIPALAESVLYSIKYGEKPLEFSIEIVNPDENIPAKQFSEIKDWLFGQDGWKKFIPESEDYEGLYLKCLLIPDSDIVDGTGYRGVKCTLKNISGFWYGEEKTIEYTSEDFAARPGVNYKYLYPEIETQFNGCIYPTVTIQTANSTNSDFLCELINYVSDDAPVSKRSSFRTELVADTEEEYVIDTRHGIITCDGTKELPENLNTSMSLLHFYRGKNKLRVPTGGYITNLKIKYTPCYRVGGF